MLLRKRKLTPKVFFETKTFLWNTHMDLKIKWKIINQKILFDNIPLSPLYFRLKTLTEIIIVITSFLKFNLVYHILLIFQTKIYVQKWNSSSGKSSLMKEMRVKKVEKSYILCATRTLYGVDLSHLITSWLSKRFPLNEKKNIIENVSFNI